MKQTRLLLLAGTMALASSFAVAQSASTLGTGGASSGPSGIHAFIWSDKDGMRSLGSLSSENFSTALGINNRGQVVGTEALGASHAFIWTAKDGIRDLNDLIPADSQIVLVAALGINDRGQIVAYGGIAATYDHDLPNTAYLLTPKGK